MQTGFFEYVDYSNYINEFKRNTKDSLQADRRVASGFLKHI